MSFEQKPLYFVLYIFVSFLRFFLSAFIFYLFFFSVTSDVLSIFVLCTGHCKAVFFFVNLYSSVLFLFHMFNSCLCYLIFFSAFFCYIFFFPFLCISFFHVFLILDNVWGSTGRLNRHIDHLGKKGKNRKFQKKMFQRKDSLVIVALKKNCQNGILDNGDN